MSIFIFFGVIVVDCFSLATFKIRYKNGRLSPSGLPFTELGRNSPVVILDHYPKDVCGNQLCTWKYN
jgi:hypothetical protein